MRCTYLSRTRKHVVNLKRCISCLSQGLVFSFTVFPQTISSTLYSLGCSKVCKHVINPSSNRIRLGRTPKIHNHHPLATHRQHNPNPSHSSRTASSRPLPSSGHTFQFQSSSTHPRRRRRGNNHLDPLSHRLLRYGAQSRTECLFRNIEIRRFVQYDRERPFGIRLPSP